MTPADRTALDDLTASLRDGTDDLNRRIAAVIDYITASPQRPEQRAVLAPATARSGWDATAADSGRPGTSPVTGPAA